MRTKCARLILIFGCMLSACVDKSKERTDVTPDTAAAPAEAIAKLPATLTSKADTEAVVKAVRDVIGMDDFDSHNGDRQPIGGVDSWIEPHVASNTGKLVSGKVLARISVDQDVPGKGYRFGTNYYVAGQFTGQPGWQALIVNLRTHTVWTSEMNTITGNKHKAPLARWLVSKAVIGAAPWATCDGGTCCCEGKGCGDPPTPFPFDSLPPDSLPPHGPPH